MLQTVVNTNRDAGMDAESRRYQLVAKDSNV
jgi:hypothetical protein